MFQILNYQTLPSSGRLLVFDLLLMAGIFLSEGLYHETKQPGLFLCLIPQRNFILHQKDMKDLRWFSPVQFFWRCEPFKRCWDQWRDWQYFVKFLDVECEGRRLTIVTGWPLPGWVLWVLSAAIWGICYKHSNTSHNANLTWRGSTF